MKKNLIENLLKFAINLKFNSYKSINDYENLNRFSHAVLKIQI